MFTYGQIININVHLSIKNQLNKHTHTHPFNGLFSRTTWVSWYQKGKTSLDLNGVLGWQWHQLDHMQTICTSLQTGRAEPHQPESLGYHGIAFTTLA